MKNSNGSKRPKRPPRRGVCLFCKCTQSRACFPTCFPTCFWLDARQTICSAPACVMLLARVLVRRARRKSPPGRNYDIERVLAEASQQMREGQLRLRSL